MRAAFDALRFLVTVTSPDLARLKAVLADLDALERAGKLTREDFDRLWAVAEEACHGFTDALESLVRFAKPAWLYREPDMASYSAAVAELGALDEAGALTREAFRRLWRRAARALQGSTCDGMELFYSYADGPDWIPR